MALADIFKPSTRSIQIEAITSRQLTARERHYSLYIIEERSQQKKKGSNCKRFVFFLMLTLVAVQLKTSIQHDGQKPGPGAELEREGLGK